MIKTAPTKGFTLIEIFISVAIVGLLFALTTPYLFGFKEKNLLMLERDRIVNELKVAQQKAISAQGGYDYSIEFSQEQNQYTRQPEGTIEKLVSGIQISSFLPTGGTSVKFLRLTGKPEAEIGLILASRRFKCQIQVDPQGVITSTQPENNEN